MIDSLSGVAVKGGLAREFSVGFVLAAGIGASSGCHGRRPEDILNSSRLVSETGPGSIGRALSLGVGPETRPGWPTAAVSMNDFSEILSAIERGDPRAAEQLLPLVYDALRQLAAEKLAHEQPGQTLQATALVHEAYLRLLAGSQTQDWSGRRHFFAAAAESMRRILIDRARHKQTRKAGGGLRRLGLDDVEPAFEEENGDRVLALDEALRQLEAEDPRKAELVKLRFFAGLTAEQAAAALGVSTSTAEKDWAYARSWLRVAIDRKSGDRS
jgi:RNA polymerase sigma factor (TIGR02999 family)